MVKKRRNIAFSLSFLDIMACGFGAVTLLLILRHNANEIPIADERLSSEISLLQQDIEQAEQDKVKALNSLEKSNLRLSKLRDYPNVLLPNLRRKKKYPRRPQQHRYIASAGQTARRRNVSN